jgi:hypothetical protein
MARDYNNKLTLRPPPGSSPFPIDPINIVLVAVDPNGVTSGQPGDFALLAGGVDQWRCTGGLIWTPIGSAIGADHALLSPASLVALASGHTGTPGSIWVFDSLGNTAQLTGAQGSVIYFNGTDWVALAPGVAGQFLKTLGPATNPLWAAPAGGGDVIGPGASTDEALVRWDGATGTAVQDSNVLLNNAGNMTFTGGTTLSVDNVAPATAGNGVVLAGVRHYASSAVDPVLPLPADGDVYYNTVLQMMMQYDGIRAKWLSITSQEFTFGRNGNTPAAVYYRTIDGRVMSSTLGWYSVRAGTVVALGYTRSDADAATFEIDANGVSIETVASAAAGGLDNSLDGDFAAGVVLAVQNALGSNVTSDVIAYIVVRWRI